MLQVPPLILQEFVLSFPLIHSGNMALSFFNKKVNYLLGGLQEEEKSLWGLRSQDGPFTAN